MRHPPPMPGSTSASPAGSAWHGGAPEQAAQLRCDRDAADAGREAAEQGRAPDREPRAWRRRGPFHALIGTALRAIVPGRASRSSPQLHQSPVRRISPSAVAITIARSPPPAPSARTGTSASTMPWQVLGPAAHLDARDALHLDGVGRAQQPGAHPRLVPGDEERALAESALAPRDAPAQARAVGPLAPAALDRQREPPREALISAVSQHQPSADRRSPCARAASGPWDRAAPRARPPRR